MVRLEAYCCRFGSVVSRLHVKMSVLSGLSKADFKTASDGLLELAEERLRNIMRTEPITDVYHVEQTPFARSARTNNKHGLQLSNLTQFC